MCSFPHFSPTCFDILSWNFAYDFVSMYYRSSSSVVNFRQFFEGVMPLLECRILKIHSFPHFSLTRFDLLSWNFAFHFFFYCTSDQVRVSSICVNFWWSYAPFGNQNTGNAQFSALFSFLLWQIELKLYIWLCLMYKRSSSSVITLCLSGSPSVHPFSALSSYIHRHI